MRTVLFCLAASALTGCLSSNPPEATNWIVDVSARPVEKLSRKYGTLRLSQVVMRTPCDSARMVVLRNGGRVAFDAYNRFAAVPNVLLRGPALDVLRASGVFASVSEPTSSAHADFSAELVVNRFVLDCTAEGVRRASVSLTLTVLDQRTRMTVASVTGAAEADAADGVYSAAFAQAFASALSKALGDL